MDDNLEHISTKIPLKSKVILGPLERYKWYGVVPSKFFVHLMIIMTSTLVALNISAEQSETHDPLRIAFFQMFLDTDLSSY